MTPPLSHSLLYFKYISSSFMKYPVWCINTVFSPVGHAQQLLGAASGVIPSQDGL